MRKHLKEFIHQPSKHTLLYTIALCAFVIVSVLSIFFMRLIVDNDTERIVLPSITAHPTLQPSNSPQIISPTRVLTPGPMCGGIAGKKCPAGSTCHGMGAYPDAAGTCQFDNLSPTPATSMDGNIVYAKADLASRLQIDQSRIRVVSAKDVTWNDGSLGCPQPGKMYTQSIVQGYAIVLSYQNEQYQYHGGHAKPFYCAQNNKE